MLLDFTVGNFGPFRDDATLSMNATKIKEQQGNLINPELSDKDILSSAIIFGPNAAGKSFIADAMYILSRVVEAVNEDISPTLYVPYRLSKSNRESPVRIRVRLIIDGILYDYRVEYKASEIIRESLYHYPKKRPARVFERTGPTGFKDAKKRYIDMTTPGRTYLAMAGVGADPICAKVRNVLMSGFITLPAELDVLVQDSCRFSGDHPERKAKTVKALSTADLGISDFTYNKRQEKLVNLKMKIPPELYEIAQRETDTLYTRDIFLRHDFTSPEVDEEGRALPMNLESAGTRCMFGLMAPLIDALENGKVLVLDELGAHLHPMLTRWIVRQFSRENNPNGAQLIANTHDLGLMDISELLRRDQIWFVNKNPENGASELYCLSDFDGVRNDTDVLRRYLDGRFNAVPAVRHRGVME